MTKLYVLVTGFLALAAVTRTVWDGVYTGAQAGRGQVAFTQKCASCHGQNLEGTNGSAVEVDGPPLVGLTFIENWREDNLGELFKFIQASMPREAAGTASDTEKLDIMAFILQRNEFPPGPAELTAESVNKVMLVGKDGPKPLPNMTAIRAVGCLASSSPGSWILSRSSEPARTRNPEDVRADELKDAKSEPLGSLTFKLPKLDVAIPGVKPLDLKGHKVLVKGVLYRQPNDEHVNVTAISSLAADCAAQQWGLRNAKTPDRPIYHVPVESQHFGHISAGSR